MAEVEALAQVNVIGGAYRVPYLVAFCNGVFSQTDDLTVAPTSISYASGASLSAGDYPIICPYTTATAKFFTCAGADTGTGSGIMIGYVQFAGSNYVGPLASETGYTGTAPTNVIYLCIYQDRLCATDGKNFYISRASKYVDWDYSKLDEGGPIAGNTLNGGNLGDNIIAMVPFVNDSLALFCTQSIYMIRGNIRAGGSIDLLSRNVGILGPQAWTYDPAGNVYFADTTGFYRMTSAGQIENLSRDLLNSYFEKIERGNYRVQLRWQESRKGCWIFITRKSTAGSIHLWYDARTGGFFPQQIPTSQGPISSVAYEGNILNDRSILMGGRDGYVRKFDDSVAEDDGTAIASHVWIGPFEPAGAGLEAKCIALDAILGETPSGFADTDWNCEPTLYVGHDPNSAINAAEQNKAFAAWTGPGRQDAQATRLGGNTFWLHLNNATIDKLFVVDRIVGRFLAAGKEDGRYV